MTQLLLLLGVVVLVGLNGFFVAAEFSLVRSRESRLEQMRDEGLRGVDLVLVEVDRIDEYLSACQLGITMASLGIGFLGEPAIASLLEDALGDALPHGVTLAISLGFAYFVTTALHITIGEQVPKIYAITHAEGVARRAARLLEAFRVTFKPLIWALNTVSNGILRAVGVNPKAEFEEVSSSDEETSSNSAFGFTPIVRRIALETVLSAQMSGLKVTRKASSRRAARRATPSAWVIA